GRGSSELSPDVLDLLAAAHFVRAPARAHAVGAADEDRLDAADLIVLDLEQLAELPGPVDRPVVEEREREHDPPLAIHGDEAAVADARHCADQRGFELLLAALDFLAAHADRARRTHDDDPVLVTQAIVGER